MNIKMNEDLVAASEAGCLEDVKQLLENGADVHVNDDAALFWSARNGHTDVVRMLLENGADVHANNNQPLLWSVINWHVKIVKLLLEHGADLHANDDYALRWATYCGHPEILETLESIESMIANDCWNIPVSYIVSGVVRMPKTEHPSLKLAMAYAYDEDNDISLPDDAQYVAGSWCTAEKDVDVDEVRMNYNDGELDIVPEKKDS